MGARVPPTDKRNFHTEWIQTHKNYSVSQTKNNEILKITKDTHLKCNWPWKRQNIDTLCPCMFHKYTKQCSCGLFQAKQNQNQSMKANWNMINSCCVVVIKPENRKRKWCRTWKQSRQRNKLFKLQHRKKPPKLMSPLMVCWQRVNVCPLGKITLQ